MQISFSELCRSLVDEFAVALTTVKRSHPTVRVNSVKLALGQTGEDIGVRESREPRTLILNDRYPGSESGWRLELELGERSGARIEGVKRPLVSRTDPMILDIIAWEPVAVIDGISLKWSEFLANFDITQVIDLARIDPALLEEITLETNSLQVREFRQKVLLLKLPFPALTKSSLGKASIYEVLKSPIKKLEDSFSPPATRSEIRYLFEALDLLNVAVDNRHLRKIALDQLLGL